MRKSQRVKNNKNDFLGLRDTTKYPKVVKLYNFYIKKYVFLEPDSYIQEIDLYDYHRCNYQLTDM